MISRGTFERYAGGAWLLALVVEFIYVLPETRNQPPLWLAWTVALTSVAVFLYAASYTYRFFTSTDSLSWAAVGRSGAGIVAVVAGLGSWEAFKWDLQGRGTPPPPVIPNLGPDPARDPSYFDTLRAYARRLEYDSTGHGGPDSAYLTVTVRDPVTQRVSVIRTVKGTLEPERRAHLNRFRNLEGVGPRRGRVVARVIIDTTVDTLGYSPLNLPPGVSYLWVDGLTRPSDTLGTYRLLIIPERGDSVLLPPPGATNTYRRHRRRFANYSIARLSLGPHSDCTNMPCDSHGCCQACGGS